MILYFDGYRFDWLTVPYWVAKSTARRARPTALDPMAVVDVGVSHL